MPGLPRLQIDPVKGTQLAQRRTVALRSAEVELDHLVSLSLTGVGQVGFDDQGVSCFNLR